MVCGRIYRSGELSRLTASDAVMIGTLGIAAVIDLRTVDERSAAPSTCTQLPAEFYGSPIPSLAPVLREILAIRSPEGARQGMMRYYRQMPGLYREDYAAMFSRIADGQLPILVHCTAGKDRTGVAIALLLSSLGVSRADVFVDYALTEQRIASTVAARQAPMGATPDAYNALAQLPRETRAALWRADPEYLQAALDSIDRDYGSVLIYLQRGLGMTANGIEALRALLVR